ncbi:protein-cysteine N-palmitoyltransferase HHAT [Ixodes scapularis]
MHCAAPRRQRRFDLQRRSIAGHSLQLRARLYPVFSALALAWTVCWECVLLVFAVYATFFLLAGLRIRIVCYLVSLLALVYSFFTHKWDPMLLVEKRRGDMEYFLTSITVPWTVLRCLSFSVDFATDPESSKRRFPDFWMSLAYVFYLPSVCLGPLMNYDNFVAQTRAGIKTPMSCRFCRQTFTMFTRSGPVKLLIKMYAHGAFQLVSRPTTSKARA